MCHCTIGGPNVSSGRRRCAYLRLVGDARPCVSRRAVPVGMLEMRLPARDAALFDPATPHRTRAQNDLARSADGRAISAHPARLIALRRGNIERP
jgi:hypothetical protein